MDHLNKDVPVDSSSTFTGHQTFALRVGWLKKGYDALINEGGFAFTKENTLVILGVGKNMVVSIRHWLVLFGVAEECGKGELRATSFGNLLFSNTGFDPYLEHVATLWILHTNICSPKSSAFTWFYAFHQWRRQEFLRDKLIEAIHRRVQITTRPPSQETVSRDVECFLHTYVPAGGSKAGRQAAEDGLESPLTGLGLITVQTIAQGYRLAIGPKPHLSTAVFAWALAQFWQQSRSAATTLSATEVMYAVGSPGMTFKLDEESVLAYLDSLSAMPDPAFRFEDNPHSQQVVRVWERFDETRLLEACYARR